MASKYSQKFPIPEGFADILHDFTREILRDQPEDIIEYATLYFEALRDNKPFHYESKYNVKPEKPQGSHYNPKEKSEFDPQNPPLKAQKSNDVEKSLEIRFYEAELNKEEIPIEAVEVPQYNKEESIKDQEESQQDKEEQNKEEPLNDQEESQRENQESQRDKEEQDQEEPLKDQEEPLRDQESHRDKESDKEEQPLNQEDSRFSKDDSPVEKEKKTNISNDSRGTSHKEEKSIAREYIKDLNEEILDQAIANDDDKNQEKSQDLTPN